MLIKELTEKMTIGDCPSLDEILEIRTYLPIAEKKAICETILDRCYSIEDGVLLCNSVLKRIMFELAMVKYHTDLDIEIDSEDDYDELQQSSINFRWGYAADYVECEEILYEMEEELKSQYSIETSIARLSNRLAENIEGVVSVITNKVNNLDTNAFGFESADIDKIKTLLNKYGK